MRDLVVAACVFIWVPFILLNPHVGVLVWNWVSHMAPQFHSYGFARSFPFLDLIAALTVLGVFISRERKIFTLHPIIVLLFAYYFWLILTTLLGYDPTFSSEKLIYITKVMLFAVISMIVMQTPNRLKAFVWVMYASFAFIMLKSGIFTLVTGGAGRVQGAGGMIIDNNQLAMALAMILPISIYMWQHPPIPRLKTPLLGLVVLNALSILGTQSRGGLVALLGVVAMILLKSKYRFRFLLVMIPVALLAFSFMPDSWKNRMNTTASATEDGSFMGRVSMWKFSVNLADTHPIEGGGFNVFYLPRPQERFMPPRFKPRAPHSIYFEVMGEHGYVGLVLFMSLIFTGWFAGGSIFRTYHDHNETRWIADLGGAIQLSMVGYAVGGLTVNIATFDLFYHLLAILVMCSIVGGRVLERTNGRALHGLPPQNSNEVSFEDRSETLGNKKPKKANKKAKWSPYD